MAQTKTKHIISDFHTHVLETGNLDLLDQYLIDNFIFHTPYLSYPLQGRDKFQAYMSQVYSAISNFKTTLNDIITEGNRASVRWTIE